MRSVWEAPRLFCVIFTGVWCLIGVIFLGVGAGLRRHAVRMRKRCSEEVWGTVTDILFRQDGLASPIVEYETPRGTMKQCSAVATSRCHYAVGEQVAVRYDPDDPSHWILADSHVGRTVGTVFLWVGLGCIIIGLGVSLLTTYLCH